jgi:hypothetical protein
MRLLSIRDQQISRPRSGFPECSLCASRRVECYPYAPGITAMDASRGSIQDPVNGRNRRNLVVGTRNFTRTSRRSLCGCVALLARELMGPACLHVPFRLDDTGGGAELRLLKGTHSEPTCWPRSSRSPPPMSEIVANPADPSCYLLLSGPGIEESQTVDPDPFASRAMRTGVLPREAPATRAASPIPRGVCPILRPGR